MEKKEIQDVLTVREWKELDEKLLKEIVKKVISKDNIIDDSVLEELKELIKVYAHKMNRVGFFHDKLRKYTISEENKEK